MDRPAREALRGSEALRKSKAAAGPAIIAGAHPAL